MPSEARGYGLGLRRQHYEDILRERPRVDWFEILTENYLVDGGRPLHYLERIRADYPLAMHGVSLSIGSLDPLDRDYLRHVQRLAARIEPAWISDHLCWTGVDGINTHDLLPLPFTEESLRHVAERVQQVQDLLGRRILLENVSSYFQYAHSTLAEWDFLRELVRRTDCRLLLDVNNVYVAAVNHGFDAECYLRALPAASIGQLHIAGHEHCSTHLLDTHDRAIAEPVWQLFGAALRLFGPVPASIERDAAVPALAELLDELERLRAVGAAALAARAENSFVSTPSNGAAKKEHAVALRDVQVAVQQCVLTQRTAPDFIVESPTLPRAVRMNIYAHGYRTRLIEALAHDFSALQAWLGERQFAAMIDAYIDAHPSRHRSLRDVGQRLETFLATTTSYAGHPDLCELARFEWALCEAFDAADAPPATLDDFHAVAAAQRPDIRLRFHPSLQRLSLTGNAPALWRALREETEPPPFVATGDRTQWIVWRKQLQLLFRPLAAAEGIVLQAFGDGASLAEAGAQLHAEFPSDDAPALLAGIVQRWLRDELIAAALPV